MMRKPVVATNKGVVCVVEKRISVALFFFVFFFKMIGRSVCSVVVSTRLNTDIFFFTLSNTRTNAFMLHSLDSRFR